MRPLSSLALTVLKTIAAPDWWSDWKACGRDSATADAAARNAVLLMRHVGANSRAATLLQDLGPLKVAGMAVAEHAVAPAAVPAAEVARSPRLRGGLLGRKASIPKVRLRGLVLP